MTTVKMNEIRFFEFDDDPDFVEARSDGQKERPKKRNVCVKRFRSNLEPSSAKNKWSCSRGQLALQEALRMGER